jgi:hypothetical protein
MWGASVAVRLAEEEIKRGFTFGRRRNLSASKTHFGCAQDRTALRRTTAHFKNLRSEDLSYITPHVKGRMAG